MRCVKCIPQLQAYYCWRNGKSYFVFSISDKGRTWCPHKEVLWNWKENASFSVIWFCLLYCQEVKIQNIFNNLSLLEGIPTVSWALPLVFVSLQCYFLVDQYGKGLLSIFKTTNYFLLKLHLYLSLPFQILCCFHFQAKHLWRLYFIASQSHTT